MHTKVLVKKEIIPFKPKSSKGEAVNENTTETTTSEDVVQKTVDKNPQKKREIRVNKDI